MSASDLLPTLAGLLLVVAAAIFASWPLLHRGSEPAAADSAMLSADPTAERLLIYKQVLELEFDLQMGKLSKADFEAVSAELLGQAAALLRAEGHEADSTDLQIEREIAEARRLVSRNAAGLASPPALP